VVIFSAALSKDIAKTVVTLSTQSYGTGGISKLRENKCSALLIHGNSDLVLSSYCSSHIYNKAKEPKQRILYDNASHSLDEVADEVFHKVQKLLVEKISKDVICFIITTHTLPQANSPILDSVKKTSL